MIECEPAMRFFRVKYPTPVSVGYETPMRLMAGDFASCDACNIRGIRKLKNVSTSKRKGSRLSTLFHIFNERAIP